jgi:hypothetical protein
MDKRNKMNSDYAKVHSRLGKTTGASKGAAKAPKAEVKVKPVGGIKNLTKGPQGAKVTYTKKF